MSINSVNVVFNSTTNYIGKPVADTRLNLTAPGAGAASHIAVSNRSNPVSSSAWLNYSFQSPNRVLYSWKKEGLNNTQHIISNNGTIEINDTTSTASSNWTSFLAEPNAIINVVVKMFGVGTINTDTTIHHWRFDTWLEYVPRLFSFFNSTTTAPNIYYPNVLTADTSFVITLTNQFFEKGRDYVLAEFTIPSVSIINGIAVTALSVRSDVFGNQTRLTKRFDSPQSARWVITPVSSGTYSGTMTCSLESSGRQLDFNQALVQQTNPVITQSCL